jgi:hypothetical protein
MLKSQDLGGFVGCQVKWGEHAKICRRVLFIALYKVAPFCQWRGERCAHPFADEYIINKTK